MVDELCDICRHSKYDYETMTVICQIDNEIPKYVNYCDKVFLIEEEKLKLQENFNRKKKQTNVWKRLFSLKTYDLANRNKYFAKLESKLELRSSKSYYWNYMLSFVFFSFLVIYILVDLDFEWFGFNTLTFIIFSFIAAGLHGGIKNLTSKEIKLVIDSNGIEILKDKKHIPWELMFNIFITESNDSEAGNEYCLHIWSLLGDYKINLSDLDSKIDKIANLIGYFKDLDRKYNKLGITQCNTP